MKQVKTFAIAGVAAVAAMGAGQAQAGYCDTTGYTYGLSDCVSGAPRNTPATVVTAAQVLRASTAQVAGQIGGRIANVAAGVGGFTVGANGFSASTGLAGGDMADKMGVWLSGSWTGVEDSFTATAFEGDVYTIMAGVDYQLDDRSMIGLAFGYDVTDIETQFNRNTTTLEDGSIEGDGFTIAPYFSYKLDKNFSATATLGYSWVEYDLLRFDVVNTRITGSQDATRLFFNGGVSSQHKHDMWRFRTNASWLYATEDRDGFTESDGTVQSSSDSHLSQLRINGTVGYDMDGFEPYLKAGIEYDMAKTETTLPAGQVQPANDDFGALFGAGFNLRVSPDVTGGFEASTIEFREDYDEYTLQGNLRIRF